MPIYDFTCPQCGAAFEELIAKESSDNPVCPQCGNKETERKMSCPSPLKTGAFPYKLGPVRPLSRGGAPSCGGGSCPMSGQ
ncbi:MAG: zinc ribbon domain-containing protein [Desulfovibrio sp.]|nr:zinc ribbon domain-containing protein [Desulfovibrio sp.]